MDAAEAVAKVEVAAEVEAVEDGINSNNNKILSTSKIKSKILSYNFNNNNSYLNIVGHMDLVDMLLMYVELHLRITVGRQHLRTG